MYHIEGVIERAAEQCGKAALGCQLATKAQGTTAEGGCPTLSVSVRLAALVRVGQFGQHILVELRKEHFGRVQGTARRKRLRQT